MPGEIGLVRRLPTASNAAGILDPCGVIFLHVLEDLPPLVRSQVAERPCNFTADEPVTNR